MEWNIEKAQGGLSPDQIWEIEFIEERRHDLPVEEVVRECQVFIVDPRLTERRLRGLVMLQRRFRQRVMRETKSHLRACGGCDECLPPAPLARREIKALVLVRAEGGAA
jgi:hypothetical protein